MEEQLLNNNAKSVTEAVLNNGKDCNILHSLNIAEISVALPIVNTVARSTLRCPTVVPPNVILAPADAFGILNVTSKNPVV